MYYLYLQVNITMKRPGKFEHQGIKIEFIGQIGELSQEKNTLVSLTHCGLVAPYGAIKLGQHWLR